MPPEDKKLMHRRRRHYVLGLRRKGLTFQHIGEMMGLTRERIRQMCNQAYDEEKQERRSD